MRSLAKKGVRTVLNPFLEHDPHLAEIVGKMLQFDPFDRMTAHDVEQCVYSQLQESSPVNDPNHHNTNVVETLKHVDIMDIGRDCSRIVTMSDLECLFGDYNRNSVASMLQEIRKCNPLYSLHQDEQIKANGARSKSSQKPDPIQTTICQTSRRGFHMFDLQDIPSAEILTPAALSSSSESLDMLMNLAPSTVHPRSSAPNPSAFFCKANSIDDDNSSDRQNQISKSAVISLDTFVDASLNSSSNASYSTYFNPSSSPSFILSRTDSPILDAPIIQADSRINLKPTMAREAATLLSSL